MFTGCTTIPSRFQNYPQISPNGGYIIESEDENGFSLEIFYKSFSFTPSPDDNIQDAKNFFIRIAQDFASKRKHSIKPIIASQLKTSFSRNIIDGMYAIYISGKVYYEK